MPARESSARSRSADDIVTILRAQHETIKSMFSAVTSAVGAKRQEEFDHLRAMLAVHETAEQMILRPTTKTTAGEQVANARNSEEKQANKDLARLEKLNPASTEFEIAFADFQKDVLTHAEREESLEFPGLMQSRSLEEREKMGRALRAVERLAPTHPHPSTAGSTSAQYLVGPFAAMIDRTRDALRSASTD